MRLIDRQDATLAIALIFGTGVVFGQPLRFVLSVAEEISATYHVDLVPGFMIFVLAFTVHFWRKQKDAVTLARLQERDAEEARRVAADLEELVRVSHALADAVDSEALRTELMAHLPAFLRNRACWLATATLDGWRWFLEPPKGCDPDALLSLAESLATPAHVTPASNEWFVVVLESGGLPVGALGVDAATALDPAEQARAEAIANVVAIALKNVNLFSAMRTMSVSDALTGCFNRAHAFDTLQLELRRSTRTRSPIAIVLFDVDDFKTVNDRYGHLVGDQLLEAIGATLRRTLRTTDTKCRYGGDEFLVILPDTPPESARSVADHIRRAVESIELPAGDGQLECRISLGMAAAALGEVDPLAVVRRADHALYLDKASRKHDPPQTATQTPQTAIPAARTA